MTSPPIAEVLNREFLEMRARILELAAALDRLDRAAGSAAADVRFVRLRKGLAALVDAGADRAEQVQMIFSLPYEAGWQDKLQVARR